MQPGLAGPWSHPGITPAPCCSRSSPVVQKSFTVRDATQLPACMEDDAAMPSSLCCAGPTRLCARSRGHHRCQHNRAPHVKATILFSMEVSSRFGSSPSCCALSSLGKEIEKRRLPRGCLAYIGEGAPCPIWCVPRLPSQLALARPGLGVKGEANATTYVQTLPCLQLGREGGSVQTSTPTASVPVSVLRGHLCSVPGALGSLRPSVLQAVPAGAMAGLCQPGRCRL